MSLPGGVYSFLGMHFYFSRWYQCFKSRHMTPNLIVPGLSSRDDTILLLCRVGFLLSVVRVFIFPVITASRKILWKMTLLYIVGATFHFSLWYQRHNDDAMVCEKQKCQGFNLYTHIDNLQNPCHTALVQRGGKSIYYYY